MKIIEKRMVDECLGGSTYLDIIFDHPISENTISALADKGGILEYHKDFAVPLFQFRSELKFLLKGLQGENHCKLVLPSDNTEKVFNEVEKLIDQLPN